MCAVSVVDSGSRGAARGRSEQKLDLSTYAHRQLIGYLGLLLPVFLYGLASVRATPELPAWKLLNSVSAYYYSGAVAIFVGVLFGLGLFLLTYRGYSDSRADRRLGRFGALCAFAIALFPTGGTPDGIPTPEWWSGTAGGIHYVAAALLFTTFAVFSLWLFRRTDVPEGEPLPSDKRFRNRVYAVCGVVIIACILWAGSALKWPHPIFWPEALALWAFALSWLIKGRAHHTLAHAARRVKATVQGAGRSQGVS
jgi:hypothetical protein